MVRSKVKSSPRAWKQLRRMEAPRTTAMTPATKSGVVRRTGCAEREKRGAYGDRAENAGRDMR
jgi:hypothetical protein